MLDLETVRARLKDRRISVVAEATGIHLNTLFAIRDKPDCNPTMRVFSVLEKYLSTPAEEREAA